jgi:uncharacterized protein
MPVVPTLEFETIIAAPLAKVWAFFEDIEHSIPKIYANESVQLERVDMPARVGTEVVILMRGPFGKVRIAARIIEHRPPHAVVFGEEARFVDVQDSGPFKSWRHEHEFESVDSKTTRMLDRITYRLPFGPVGWLGDVVLVRHKIRAMFKRRNQTLKSLLE